MLKIRGGLTRPLAESFDLYAQAVTCGLSIQRGLIILHFLTAFDVAKDQHWRKVMRMRVWTKWGMGSSEDLLTFLIRRATMKTSTHGHLLAPWTTAKRKLGKGARRATCVTCGQMVCVLPYGRHGAVLKLAREAPMICGDALGKRCV